MRAMLISSGEIGYHRVSVQTVCDRYGGYRNQFYDEFANKAECFTAAYRVEAERICDRLLLRVKQGGSCRSRLEGAIEELTELASGESALAKALFTEVHVVGGEALEKHREIVQRLALELEAECRPAAAVGSPSLTTEFVIGVVEQAVSTSLARDAQFELQQAAPELAMILSGFYSEQD